MSVAPVEETTTYPPRHPKPSPAHSRANQRCRNGWRRGGIRWRPNPVALVLCPPAELCPLTVARPQPGDKEPPGDRESPRAVPANSHVGRTTEHRFLVPVRSANPVRNSPATPPGRHAGRTVMPSRHLIGRRSAEGIGAHRSSQLCPGRRTSPTTKGFSSAPTPRSALRRPTRRPALMPYQRARPDLCRFAQLSSTGARTKRPAEQRRSAPGRAMMERKKT